MTHDIYGNTIGYHYMKRDGVDWVFVDHPSFPRPGGIYADAYGVYGDNQVMPSTRHGDKFWKTGLCLRRDGYQVNCCLFGVVQVLASLCGSFGSPSSSRT